MQDKVRNRIAWVVVGAFLFSVAYRQQLFGLNASAASNAWNAPDPGSGPGPARDVTLPGGGVTDGSHCGAKSYHFFPLGTQTDLGGALPSTPTGPQAMLGAYGAEIFFNPSSGDFTITLGLATGSTDHSLLLAAPLGAQGVAVEIQGPQGLVGGAHDLPFTLDDDSARLPNGEIRIPGEYGLSIDLKMPAEALCPGYGVAKVDKDLEAPSDSDNTITGQPPYTLTVSISDPAIATLRHDLGSTAVGPVLTANNLNPW